MKTLADLVEQKAQLSERLDRIRKELRSPLDQDSSEQAIDLENRDVLTELERVESQNLARVEIEIQRFQ
jgi:hypothetical protein